MFGLNDNNSQSSNNTAALPANPFDEAAAPASDPVVAPSQPAADALPALPPQPQTPSIVRHDKPASPKSDDLLDLKEQALHNLQPLVGHLDQTPEEKFKTTMMLIQATDNAALVKDAYAAASQIQDEKTRAQALLDVVNEINYFTQHHDQAPEVKA